MNSKVIIPACAITDLNGNKPEANLTTEIKSADTMQSVLKTTGGVAGNYLVVDNPAGTLTITFSESISIKNAALYCGEEER